MGLGRFLFAYCSCREGPTGYPGTNVSGKTTNLISSSAACSMSRMTFFIVAFLSMKAGAACAAATLNLVILEAMASERNANSTTG